MSLSSSEAEFYMNEDRRGVEYQYLYHSIRRSQDLKLRFELMISKWKLEWESQHIYMMYALVITMRLD